MDTGIQVESLKVAELGDSERRLWLAFRAADPRLQGPYFDLRYVEAAGDVAPGGRMAVIHRRGTVVGFLPYQRRGAMLQRAFATSANSRRDVTQVRGALGFV